VVGIFHLGICIILTRLHDSDQSARISCTVIKLLNILCLTRTPQAGMEVSKHFRCANLRDRGRERQPLGPLGSHVRRGPLQREQRRRGEQGKAGIFHRWSASRRSLECRW